MPTATTAAPGADTVSALVRDHLRPQVVAIDRDGLYPGDFLRRLGAAGGLVGPGRTDDLGPALRTMAEVSETCGTTGFCLWCGHVVTDNARWCDAECRDDWEWASGRGL